MLMTKNILILSNTLEDNQKMLYKLMVKHSEKETTDLIVFTKTSVELIWKNSHSSIDIKRNVESLNNMLKVINLELDVRLDDYHVNKKLNPIYQPIVIIIDNFNNDFLTPFSEYNPSELFKNINRLLKNSKISNIKIAVLENIADKDSINSYAKNICLK